MLVARTKKNREQFDDEIERNQSKTVNKKKKALTDADRGLY